MENFVDNSERGRVLLGGMDVENFSTGFQQGLRVLLGLLFCSQCLKRLPVGFRYPWAFPYG